MEKVFIGWLLGYIEGLEAMTKNPGLTPAQVAMIKERLIEIEVVALSGVGKIGETTP